MNWAEAMRYNKKRRLTKILAGFLCMVLLAGCGRFDISNTKVVLTTGFDKDEIFRIETISCTVPEVMVYLTNAKNQYESVYGSEIWGAGFEGVSLGENIKETVLAQIAQIKTMNLMAQDYEVELDEQEQELVSQAAAKYYNSLNSVEIEMMGVDQKLIENLYREYATADKVYRYLIRDVNPEISDDEARIITVEHILIKTYALDGNGQKIEYTGADKEEALETVEKVWKLAISGETDFEELAAQYSEDENVTYSFGKGETEEAFEKAAFDLGTGEISNIVETSLGYHVIKCVSTFNKEETDANKVRIVEKKRQEVFGEEYDAYVKKLTRDLNEQLWESISFLYDPEIQTQDFFNIYDEYFGENSGV